LRLSTGAWFGGIYPDGCRSVHGLGAFLAFTIMPNPYYPLAFVDRCMVLEHFFSPTLDVSCKIQ